jgi:ribosomal protein S20
MKTAEAARQRNRQNRARLRSAIKGFRTAASEQPAQTREELPKLYSEIDVQARKGIIPKPRAARLKSRLAALANKAK